MDKTFLGYWKNNIKLGARGAWRWLGVVGKIIDLIIAATAGFVLGQGGLLNFALAGVAALFAWFGLLFLVFTLFVVPFQESQNQKEIQENQTRKIAKLERTTRSKVTTTTKIKLIPKDEYRQEEDDWYYCAYLEVFNGERNDLSDCFVNLEAVKIFVEPDRGYIDWINKIKSKVNVLFLAWATFKVDDEKIIRRGKSARVNIAKMRPSYMPFFALEDGSMERIHSKSIYFEVSLNGEIQGKPIKEIVFTGFLKREQDDIPVPEPVAMDFTGKPPTPEEIAAIPRKTKRVYRLYIEPGELPNDEKNKHLK